MQVTNGSINLHVAEDGDPSAPPILLLHGITSFGGTWDWIVPTLAERFRVLRLDFRGHGRSDRAPGEYNVAGYVSDAVAALEQAAGQPCVVMGHSLGGVTTAALDPAALRPAPGAIMEDPPLGPTVRDRRSSSLEGNSLLDGFRLMRQSIPAMQESKLPARDDRRRADGGTGHHRDVDVRREAARRRHRHRWPASLLDVDASVLDPVLTGHDRGLPRPGRSVRCAVARSCAPIRRSPTRWPSPATADHYAELSPDVEVMIVEGAGHLIHDELARVRPSVGGTDVPRPRRSRLSDPPGPKCERSMPKSALSAHTSPG